MKILERPNEIIQYSGMPFNEYFADLDVGYFDIETTGLSPRKDILMLAGLVIPSGGGYVSRQILAESPSEEAEVIQRVLGYMRGLDAVVTYNGARFDIPFLEQRMKANGIPEEILPYDLDLYRVIRYHSDLGQFLPNLKQTTVEDFLGLWTQRTDEINGKISVDLYHEWLASRDPVILEAILLHNSDDIHQLTRLMKVLPKVNFHKAMTSMGFPLRNLELRHIGVSKGVMTVSGLQKHSPAEYVYYGSGSFSFRFRRSLRSFEISAGLHERCGIVFADLNELGIHRGTLPSDPAQDEDLLVLINNGNTNYRAMNILARALAERTEELWIMEK